MIPREISRPFYKSKAWQKCRAGYIKSVGGLCERCLSNGKIVKGYIVHHKEHLTEQSMQLVAGFESLATTSFIKKLSNLKDKEERGLAEARLRFLSLKEEL